MVLSMVPILVYHDIDPGFRLGSLSPTLRQFESQMKYLSEEGYRTVGLHEADESGSVSRSVCVSFDDAYEGVRRYALPILTRYGFTATVFVVTRYAGSRCEWDLNLRWLGSTHMDWQAVRELDEAGMSVGSHTASHPNLAALPPDRVDRELRESKQDLEDALGKEVDQLSYPFGQYTADIKRLAAEAGYRRACTIRPRRGDHPRDPLALKRIPVRSIDSLRDFRAKVKDGGPSRYQDWKEGFLAMCNRSSLFARRGYDRREGVR
jgi:peptidoglycan/xylan/chitin deacetylase (PgdA/CDA1 family)